MTLIPFLRMDSFVLAEMFKYLYLLFTDPEDLVFSIDDYIFTTEAHLLPLSLSINSAVPSNNTATVRSPSVSVRYRCFTACLSSWLPAQVNMRCFGQ